MKITAQERRFPVFLAYGDACALSELTGSLWWRMVAFRGLDDGWITVVLQSVSAHRQCRSILPFGSFIELLSKGTSCFWKLSFVLFPAHIHAHIIFSIHHNLSFSVINFSYIMTENDFGMLSVPAIYFFGFLVQNIVLGGVAWTRRFMNNAMLQRVSANWQLLSSLYIF